MGFFTIMGIIVVTLVVFAIFKSVTEPQSMAPKTYVSPKPVVLNRNPVYPGEPPTNKLMRQANISLLCKKHGCTVYDIKQKLYDEMDIYDKSAEELVGLATFFLLGAEDEAKNAKINLEDTQHFIIAEWIAEFAQKYGRN